MGHEKWLIKHEEEWRVKDAIRRALFETRSSDTPESIYAVMVGVLKDLVSKMDEISLSKLKRGREYVLSDKMLKDLADGMLDYVIKRNELKVDDEMIRRRTALILEALREYSDGVSRSLAEPVINRVEQKLRDNRLEEQSQFSLLDADQIFMRLKRLSIPGMRKMLLNPRSSTLHNLLLQSIVETDFSETNITESARIFTDKLFGKIDKENPEANAFLIKIEQWLGDEKNQQSLHLLKQEWEATQREGKPPVR
ncbi:hypothetical protein EPN28_04510 [Patescibacteria group bacterium]|nr:MAG: hypothetical protein EPN28_04510 [Patescibacteria group bacterium]